MARVQEEIQEYNKADTEGGPNTWVTAITRAPGDCDEIEQSTTIYIKQRDDLSKANRGSLHVILEKIRCDVREILRDSSPLYFLELVWLDD